MIRTLLLAAALVGLVPGAAAAQAKAEATLYSRGGEGVVDVAIEIDIDRGWHLYHVELGQPDSVGTPTKVTLSGEGVTWSEVEFPEPHRYEQAGLGEGGRDTWIWGHEDRITLHAQGRLAPGATGEDVEAKIKGLTCEDNGSCIPYRQTVTSSGTGPDSVWAGRPTSFVWAGDAGDPSADEGTGAAGTDADASPGTGTAAASRAAVYEAEDWEGVGTEAREKAVTRSLAMWLLLAFVAGALLNVMPCVLPVISIKILSFVQQAGEDRKRILALGAAFALGILVVFEVLAAVAITLGMSWGEQFQSTGFLVTMIAIVFAFALSLFGVFELGVPRGVGAVAGMQREGLVDAFLKGMLATVLATPCTGPFLGSTLTWTLAQPPATVYLVFTALGLGMAVPYVVLTANPAFLRILPRPGAWMETFKQAMGFVLLLTAVYLMISLPQDLMLFTVGFLVFVGLGCWWWGRFASLDQTRARRTATLATAGLIVAAGAQVTFGWWQGLYEEGHSGGKIAWIRFEPEPFREALADGRNVFIDFTADWCPNCKYNERFVFEDDEIVALLERKAVVCFKADITHDGPYTDMVERLMEQLGAFSIPFLAVYAGDDPDHPYTRKDIVKVSTMKAIFESLPDADGTPGAPFDEPAQEASLAR